MTNVTVGTGKVASFQWVGTLTLERSRAIAGFLAVSELPPDPSPQARPEARQGPSWTPSRASWSRPHTRKGSNAAIYKDLGRSRNGA